MHRIYLTNQVLGSNTLLMKAIGLLLVNNEYCDIMFQTTLKNTLIKAKASNSITEIGCLTKTSYEKFILNLKLGLNLNFVIRDAIHQASFPVKFNEDFFSFRVSIHPSYNGDNLSLRIIRPMYFVNEIPPSFKYEGLILIGGKTGSGKTTCYYSLLKNFKGNVISLEDPVEFPLYGVNQTSVSTCGYEEGIKSVLRQVPDMIGIGEVRDQDSAKAVVNAVLTGHTVITTIHFSHVSQLQLRFEQLGINLGQHISQIIFMEDKKLSYLDLKDLPLLK